MDGLRKKILILDHDERILATMSRYSHLGITAWAPNQRECLSATGSWARFLPGGLRPRRVAVCQMQSEGGAAGVKSASAAGLPCLKQLSSSLPLAV